MDKRIVKSKNNIRAAFLHHASYEEVNKITVTELSKTANINRKTFYKYYKTIYDVMDEIILEAVHRICGHQVDVRLLMIDVNTLIKQFITVTGLLIKEFEDIKDPYFMNQLFEAVMKNIKEEMMKDYAVLGGEEFKKMIMVLNFGASGLSSLILEWYLDEKKVSKEELVVLLEELITQVGKVMHFRPESIKHLMK